MVLLLGVGDALATKRFYIEHGLDVVRLTRSDGQGRCGVRLPGAGLFAG
jgi:hypothetical protein